MATLLGTVAVLVLPPRVVLAGDRSAGSPGVVIGVLEEFAFKPGSEQLRAQLRMGIRRESAGWTALPDGVDAGLDDAPPFDQKRYLEAGTALRAQLPRAIEVTVCFDGKVRGRLSASLPEEWGPRARGAYLLRPDERLPWAGGRKDEFTGWAHVPVHRPLIVTTGGRCADPDKWAPTPFDAAELRTRLPLIREALRRAKEPGSEAGEEVFWPRKAYGSRFGDRILLVGRGEDVRLAFHVTPSGQVAYLGGGLTLIDAGDYDGDGRSEVAFMLEGGGIDGLVLYDASFSRRVAFAWEWATEKDQ